ncbi:putative MFS glucose transporter [Aspergillus undulatus]|uniref:putative MFS glucose transporter n=1 Tax=Aspergillus undulatus TaxID=1810928 RepID=UPI003CCE014B
MASGQTARSRVTPYLIYLVLITTLGPLQFGYHLAELNAPQSVITCDRKNIHTSSISEGLPQCIPMNPSQFGLVSSIYTLGGFLGALLAGPVSTKHGRLFALRATTIFFISGPVAGTLAPNIAILGLGRLLSGIGSGAAIVVGPIYVSEVAPPSSKGFFGAFTQVMTNVGILFTQTLGYFLSEGSMWRVILAVAGIVGALELLGLMLVPESPAWLVDHQKHDLAERVLQQIRGKDADIRSELEGSSGSARVEEEAGEEQSLLTPPPSNLPPKQPPVTMARVIKDPEYRPAIVAVVGVMIAQQFSGINSIIMYSVSLLQSILPTTAALLSVLISAINLIMTLCCSPLPDRIGRKSCLLYSIIGMGVNSFLLALGIYFHAKALSAIAVLLFVASFAVGVGPVPFILASELVGPEAVGATQSWALGANWISTFVVAQFFPMLNDALGGRGKIYWLFTAMSVIFAGFIYWRVPETKGKRSVDEVWGREDQRRRD